MHTLLVREEDLRAQPAGAHHETLLVALSAGRRDVGMKNLRSWVSAREHRVHFTVAILAARGKSISSSCRLSVGALRICRHFIAVTGAALGHRQPRIVGNGFNVGVTIYAPKHAVHRLLKALLPNEEAHILAVHGRS